MTAVAQERAKKRLPKSAYSSLISASEKGLTVASDGGFLAAPQVAETVQNVLRSGASLRRLANVVAIESASYEVLVEK